MSAKQAAAALVNSDADFAALLPAHDDPLRAYAAIRLCWALRGAKNLSLVAAASGVTEQQVVAAVLQYHTSCGTPLECERYAAKVFLNRRSVDERYDYIVRRGGIAVRRQMRAKKNDERDLALFWTIAWTMATGVRQIRDDDQ